MAVTLNRAIREKINMSTINKAIAETIMEHNGMYPGDHIRIIKIVTYNNQFNGGLEYASVHERENLNKYEESPACHNVQVVWRYDDKRL